MTVSKNNVRCDSVIIREVLLRAMEFFIAKIINSTLLRRILLVEVYMTDFLQGLNDTLKKTEHLWLCQYILYYFRTPNFLKYFWSKGNSNIRTDKCLICVHSNNVVVWKILLGLKSEENKFLRHWKQFCFPVPIRNKKTTGGYLM